MPSPVPSHILKVVEDVNRALLPVKSRKRYDETYNSFCEWKKIESVEAVNEDVLLANFYKKTEKLNSASLWATFSMLKSTLSIYEGIDISKYLRLKALLKRVGENYVPKKFKIFTMQNVEEFLQNANDEKYLMMKVVLIFCLNGACRVAELYGLKMKDIEDKGNMVIVYLFNTKNKHNQFFTITNDCNGYNYFKKYYDLRPDSVNHDSFFVNYANSKCTIKKVGINKFRVIPKLIAEFLNLPDSQLYTGHCLRRTSATLLADSGADIQVLKRHGGWRSNNIAEGYVEESIENKIRTSKKIFESSSIKDRSLDIVNDNSIIEKEMNWLKENIDLYDEEIENISDMSTNKNEHSSLMENITLPKENKTACEKILVKDLNVDKVDITLSKEETACEKILTAKNLNVDKIGVLHISGNIYIYIIA